jgi:cysteine desulfurase
MPEIYLDHNATTPLDPYVREAMQPWLGESFGNPSCAHRRGREARAAVDKARRDLSEIFGCARDEIIFTSGGTESNNLAIKGAAFALQERGRHILIGAAEHPSVSATARSLESSGFEISTIPTDKHGQITHAAVVAAMRDDTILVSIMHAQNVVGTINRVDELAELFCGKGKALHTDAAQSVGKIPTAFSFLGADLMTLVGHKMYGPTGVGALIVRRGLNIKPLLHGAGHEGGRRPGTENVAGIVGLAAACLRGRSLMASSGERMVALRDALQLRLASGVRGVLLNGSPLDRLPNTINLSFLGVSGAALAARVPDLLLATGPACHDRSEGPSPTFEAMGLGVDRSGSSLRISLGRHNTFVEMEEVADQLLEAVGALRAEANVDDASLPESDRPECPRCELHPLKLELMGQAPAVVCEKSPTCRYEAFLAEPAGVA